MLNLTNHDDRTASGTWTTGGGVATPVTILSDGRHVKVESTVTPAHYTGTLNADGVMAGTLEQESIVKPLTLTRAEIAR